MNISVKPAALPTTVAELDARRALKSVPNLNDDIERIHRALWDDPNYRRFHEAVFDEDAIEGSCTADNLEAAAMIRDYAKDESRKELGYIGKKNKTTIVKSMNVVLRRYHMSRKERAQTVAGEIVPNNGNVAE
jgi:hypothetical protein